MAFDYSSSFAGINSAIGNIGRRFESDRKRQTLADLGQDIQSGNYTAAAQKAFAAGDADTGISLAKLGQNAKQESDWLASNGGLLGLGGGSASAAPVAAAAPANIGNPNEIETRFLNTVKGAGLTNPLGLAAVAATGRAESGYSPKNVNRVWNDPSQSGQAGQAGGIMSWRADRLQNLMSFAQQRGEQQPSVETQALFLAQEDPQLIPRLNAAKTPQEAAQVMANAWRFAGYDKPGGEAARRAALTQMYAARLGGQGGGVPAPAPVVAGGPVPPPGVQVAETEEDVRRLEGSLPPANQVAQADIPAPGAQPAQGFAIPGGQVDVSIANDPQVMNLQRALAGAPERYKPSIQSRLNLRVEELKAQRAQNAPSTDFRNYERARNDPAFAQFLKDQRAKTEVNLKNEGTIPAGYRAVRDAQGNVERLEAIPGGEAASKAAEAEKKADVSRQQSEMTGNVVINALDDVERLMKESWVPTTGGIGSLASNLKGTAAHDIKNALTTIGANISFENLKLMRQASPTGGALGAVSDSEQKMLQNAWGALEQSQSEGQFKTNLARVRGIFERVVHGRVLTLQERKSGGPMTPDRAKSLRGEAAAAIAAGADKAQVLGRLKDFGLSGDGL